MRTTQATSRQNDWFARPSRHLHELDVKPEPNHHSAFSGGGYGTFVQHAKEIPSLWATQARVAAFEKETKGNMERFVVRGDAAIAYEGEIKARGKGMRQTRIVDGSKVVVEEQVQHLKDELDDARTTANMLSILDALETQFISLEMLEKTLIGRSLTRLERRAESAEVKEKAQRLLKIWKVRAKVARRRRERRVRTYGRNAAE